MVLVEISREETHVSADLQEDSWEVVEHWLQKLQAKRARHLCHAHQPVRGIRIDQLTQVLFEGKQGKWSCEKYEHDNESD